MTPFLVGAFLATITLLLGVGIERLRRPMDYLMDEWSTIEASWVRA